MTTEKKKTATKKKPAAKAKAKPVVMDENSIKISNYSSKSFSCVLRVLESLLETERDLLKNNKEYLYIWRNNGYKLRVEMMASSSGCWNFIFIDIPDDEKEKPEDGK